MSESNQSRAGRIAKDVFTHSSQRDAFSRQEQEKAHATAAAKIARLRALRLARDAAQKDSGASEAVGSAAPESKPRKTAGKRGGRL